MAIETISSINSTSSNSATATARLSTDYDSFLKLLTAQVSNQDPLAPMDSTTFVTQLAQLSQVEQSIVTNSNLEAITAQLAASGALGDIQLIGHDVTLASDTIELRNGASRFEYQLDAAADKVSARILAEDGTLVRELQGLAGAANGKVHTIEWDGLDDDGLPVPDAVFTVEMAAETADGTAVSVSTYSTSRVEELSFDTGQPVLKLRNGTEVVSGQIIAIR